MAVCASYGIPHSRFLAWDRDDRDKAIWWEIHRREACPECGTRPDEWEHWDPGRDGQLGAPYQAELRKCWGCETKAETQKNITEAMGTSAHVVLVRNPEVR